MYSRLGRAVRPRHRERVPFNPNILNFHRPSSLEGKLDKSNWAFPLGSIMSDIPLDLMCVGINGSLQSTTYR